MEHGAIAHGSRPGIAAKSSSSIRSLRSEAQYRFAPAIRAPSFPNGRTIRLRELKIIPRRLDFRLMAGSFWIDEDSHAVVRALIRPARPFDFEQDVSDEDAKDIPGFVKPIRIEVRFLTIDYGLWTGRWWLPRLIAMDAVATAGSFLQVPMRYERLYDEYEVGGDTARCSRHGRLRRRPWRTRSRGRPVTSARSARKSRVGAPTAGVRCSP
jgi:hypothetical protein